MPGAMLRSEGESAKPQGPQAARGPGGRPEHRNGGLREGRINIAMRGQGTHMESEGISQVNQVGIVQKGRAEQKT